MKIFVIECIHGKVESIKIRFRFKDDAFINAAIKYMIEMVFCKLFFSHTISTSPGDVAYKDRISSMSENCQKIECRFCQNVLTAVLF